MKEKEMKRIGEWIVGVILEKLETEKVRKEVKELCKRFPTSLSFWNERSE
jgi:glycine/serine hydroxymethyltransferase